MAEGKEAQAASRARKEKTRNLNPYLLSVIPAPSVVGSLAPAGAKTPPERS